MVKGKELNEQKNTLDKKATAAHNIWAHWMKYFFSQCTCGGENGVLCVPIDLEKRWKRLMSTEFEDLSDEEKESDYEVARKFLKNI